MQTISDTINHLHLGEATTFEGLAVFPLFGDHVRDADYLTLDEALEQGQARVIEVSEAGEVPNLLFDNLGDRKVLLVDGDELIGAKQNRIINLTILVPAHTRSRSRCPAWKPGAGRTRAPGSVRPSVRCSPVARAAKAEQVTVRMKRSGERYSDQSEVWDNIAECSAAPGCRVVHRAPCPISMRVMNSVLTVTGRHSRPRTVRLGRCSPFTARSRDWRFSTAARHSVTTWNAWCPAMRLVRWRT